jgi:hypothetical protein
MRLLITAKRMLKAGLSDKEIITYTMISVDALQKLKKSLQIIPSPF